MGRDPGRSRGIPTTFRGWIRLGGRALMRGMAALALVGVVAASISAQQPAASAPALVFNGVAVIDVEQGKLVPNQRVVITGNRIRAVGDTDAVPTPKGAQVVDAQGKYLIPGLWDMHTHPRRLAHLFYPLLIANGVTGIRDAGSEVPIDTLLLWRREILAGTRVGPPRQLLSGQSIAGPQPGCDRKMTNNSPQTCVTDSADAVHFVDSLKAAGADMIKPRDLETRALYFAVAAEARRKGIPFGGHMTWGAIGQGLTYTEASDSGARMIDHDALGVPIFNCWGPTTTVEQCQPIAERFRRNSTWWVLTLVREGSFGPRSKSLWKNFQRQVAQFWGGQGRDASPEEAASGGRGGSDTTSLGYGGVAQRVGMPILAGTDAGAPVLRTIPPGFSLHTELAFYAAEGLTPLTVLQSATLNPAKMLNATDSLGTVAPGKLADLVLLDANPLADITNTTAIRAVVANGRYFDRAALDGLLAEVKTKAVQEP